MRGEKSSRVATRRPAVVAWKWRPPLPSCCAQLPRSVTPDTNTVCQGVTKVHRHVILICTFVTGQFQIGKDQAIDWAQTSPSGPAGSSRGHQPDSIGGFPQHPHHEPPQQKVTPNRPPNGQLLSLLHVDVENTGKQG